MQEFLSLTPHRLFCPDDPDFPLSRFTMTMEENGFCLEVTGEEFFPRRVCLSWPLKLPAETRVLGDAWERGYGDLQWESPRAGRFHPWYLLFHLDGLTHGAGVMTGCDTLCCWEADGDILTLHMNLENGTCPTLAQGRTLTLCHVRIRRGPAGESPMEAGRAFCRMLCPRPRLPREPVLGINNWYYAYGNARSEEILRDADFFASLAPHGLSAYAVIDDGWQIMHDPSYNGGPWHQGNSAFPDMHALALALRERGMRPGLWFRPLVTKEADSSLNLMHNRDASFTVLDPSRPEVLDRVREDTARFRSWGYELIKHDFTSFDITGLWGPQMGLRVTRGDWHFHDRTRTTARILLDLYRALRQGAGDALLLGCNTFSHLSAGLFEIQRTGDDTSGREWARTRKMGVNTLAFRMMQHNLFYACDADCAGITPHIPWEKNREWLRVLALSGTPLFLSMDVRAVTPSMRDEIRAALECSLAQAVSGRIPEPLDWLTTSVPSLWQSNGERFHFDFGEDGA